MYICRTKKKSGISYYKLIPASWYYNLTENNLYKIETCHVWTLSNVSFDRKSLVKYSSLYVAYVRVSKLRMRHFVSKDVCKLKPYYVFLVVQTFVATARNAGMSCRLHAYFMLTILQSICSWFLSRIYLIPDMYDIRTNINTRSPTQYSR